MTYDLLEVLVEASTGFRVTLKEPSGDVERIRQ
jgi:hypothetical protein